jgi:anti-sigma regulatory factor (Ser/Thr protein kinase)
MTSWGVGPTGGDVLLIEHFDVGDLRWLRSACYVCALKSGLDEGRAMGFVFAINEGTTNAVLHGGGTGQLILLRSDTGRLIAQVVDTGPGSPVQIPEHLPPSTSTSGRGLWAARQMVDEMTLTTGFEGTTLRLEVAGAVNDSWTGNGVYADLVPDLASILFAETPRPLGRAAPATERVPQLAGEVLGELGQP